MSLTLTMLWANLTDNKLMIFFLFFQENRLQHFMQIVPSGNVKGFFLEKIRTSILLKAMSHLLMSPPIAIYKVGECEIKLRLNLDTAV